MEAIDFALADEAYGAVVMTSANAARAVAAHPDRARLTALSAFTVGRHTADAPGQTVADGKSIDVAFAGVQARSARC